EVGRLLEAAWSALRPGGQMVVNVATLESLSTTHQVLKRLAGGVAVLLVNVARGTEQLETLRFEAVNPTFLLTVGKPAAPYRGKPQTRCVKPADNEEEGGVPRTTCMAPIE